MREKLIKLLKHEFGTKVAEITADYLISKGVTILPEGAIILTRAEIEALNEHNEKVKRELAREIFEEIENILDRHSIAYLKVGQICGEHYYDGDMQFDIAELKKKYTESEGK